jgi:hypothetical protein
MASLSNALDPNAIFLKTKNYYLWEPNNNKMPSGAINYRWRTIVGFAKYLL